MLESFTVATFAERVGDTFRLQVDDGHSLDVSLVEAVALPASASGPARRPFSVVFSGPPEPLLPQRIYRLEHAGIGTFDLFLVPIGQDADGVRYEAVFT